MAESVTVTSPLELRFPHVRCIRLIVDHENRHPPRLAALTGLGMAVAWASDRHGWVPKRATKELRSDTRTVADTCAMRVTISRTRPGPDNPPCGVIELSPAEAIKHMRSSSAGNPCPVSSDADS